MAGNSNSGRRPTPLRVLALEGKKSQSRRKPIPKSDGKPRMPRGFNADEKWMWQHVLETRSTWVSKSDGPQLQTLCQFWGLLRVAIDAAKRDPIDKKNRIAVTQYQQRFDSLSGKFGLSPVDRTRPVDDQPDDKTDDKTSKYLR